jgi:hypothetical protein
MVSMARNWLSSAELPASFWFYAVRRTAEVCNYFPTKLILDSLLLLLSWFIIKNRI